MNPKQRMDELPIMMSLMLYVICLLLVITMIMSSCNNNNDTNEIDREQQEQFLDSHRETVNFYPEDAVYHLQKGLTGEGYPCEVDGVLGNETITAYNEWRVNNEEADSLPD